MKRKYVFMAMLLLGLASCVKDVTFKGEQSDPLLVVNGIQQVGMPARLSVEKSHFFMDAVADCRVKDVVVDLYVNGVFKETLQVRDSILTETYLVWDEEIGDSYEQEQMTYAFNYCEGQYVLAAGDQLRFVVNSSEFEPASAELTMPETPNVVSFDTVKVDIQDNVVSFALVLNDPPGKDYYNLCPEGELNGFSSNDPVFFELTDFEVGDIIDVGDKEYYAYGQFNIFNDTYFNGRVYSVSLKKAVWGWDYMEPFVLEVSKVDENLYRYKKTYEAYQSSDPESLLGMFTEPVQVFSNVENGVGVVCAKSQPLVFTIELPENPEFPIE